MWTGQSSSSSLCVASVSGAHGFSVRFFWRNLTLIGGICDLVLLIVQWMFMLLADCGCISVVPSHPGVNSRCAVFTYSDLPAG